MSQKMISVNLYGGKGIFGGKEMPLEASQIFCDKYNSCSYYKNNQCLCVRSFGGRGCKFGREITERGYTSRSRNYHEFKRKWETHENYRKLSHPSQKLGLIDGIVILPYPHVYVEEEGGLWKVGGPMLFASECSYIPLEEFTPDLIKRICDHRPQALMGGEIKSYQEETVPLFLSHLKEVLPEKYQEFVAAYPQAERKISFVGRTALLKTIAPSTVEYKSSSYPQFNEVWNWDGEKLIFEEGYVHGFSVTKDYSVGRLEIVPSDKSTITITSDDQVTKDTIFVD